MIFIEDLINILEKNKIKFFTGVPDSILENLSKYLEKYNKKKHIIATNEGSAVSLGMGYNLSTRKIPCIYLQNSGIGNAINPLISIAHKKIYSIPVLLMIGWRGAPNTLDEPQHMVKGKITTNLLKLLDINFCIIKNKKDLPKLNNLIKKAYKFKKPIACLIGKNILKIKKIKKKSLKKNNLLKRKDFIVEFLKLIPKSSKIISTTGYTSRELLQIREKNNLKNGKDFYMVGGMGHSAMVALGYSLNSKKQVFCLDGDGSMLMHLGSLRTFGYFGNYKLKHILLNNNAHESVGGQVTTASKIDFKNLSKSLGYKNYYRITSQKDIKNILKKFLNSKGPSFLEVLISIGSLPNLLRPDNLIKIKNKFML